MPYDEPHLSDAELTRAAHGHKLEVSHLLHLHECQACNHALDGKRPPDRASSRRGFPRPPQWLKEASSEAYRELSSLLPALSERRPAEMRTTASSRWVAAGVVALGAVAALVVGLQHRPWRQAPLPSDDRDVGQVALRAASDAASADLSCRATNGASSLLLDEESACPVDAQLEISATVPIGRWQHVAFVVCDQRQCSVGYSNPVGTAHKLAFRIKNGDVPGERRGFLVLSKEEVLAETVSHAVGAPQLTDLRHLEQLQLGVSAQQIPFSFQVSDAKPQ